MVIAIAVNAVLAAIVFTGLIVMLVSAIRSQERAAPTVAAATSHRRARARARGRRRVRRLASA